MQTHEQLVAKLMRHPGVRKEVERIEREEGELPDMICGEWVFGTKLSVRQKEINSSRAFSNLLSSAYMSFPFAQTNIHTHRV